MKTVKTPRLLAAVYNDYEIELGYKFREWLNSKLMLLLGATTDVKMMFRSTGNQCYVSYDPEKKRYRIVIGGQMLSDMALLPEAFSEREKVVEYFDSIIKAFKSATFHEGGHILVTDMESRDITDYKDPSLRNLMHNVCNVEEDVVLEATIAVIMPETRACFEMMVKNMFLPQCDEWEDRGDASSFVGYLLLASRCGESAVKNPCKVWKDHPEIKTKWIDILTTSDGTERLHKVIAFVEWLVDNVPEIEWKETPPTEIVLKERPVSGTGGKPLGKAEVDPGAIKETLDGPKGSGGGPSGSHGSDHESDSDDAEMGEPGAPTEEKGADEKPGSPTPLMEPTEEILDEVFSDVDGSDHEWVIAKDVYEYDPVIVDKVNDQIQSFVDSINDVTAFLKLFKGRRRARDLSGFTRGKLDIKRAMQDEGAGGCDTRLFKQSVKRGKDIDLAIWLMGDNSGSMGGDKSVLCSRGILTLAQACDWADVPFCSTCFTKTSDSYSGTCITIVEKDFDDPFEKAKPFFGINDSGLIRYLHSEIPIPTFAGNSEEINLWHAWQKFRQNEHKNKVLFVLCDGATTGSRDTLRKVVRDIEDDGILVIGIGIMASEVASIYPHHKLFNSQEELERDLAQYLVDTLTELSTY